MKKQKPSIAYRWFFCAKKIEKRGAEQNVLRETFLFSL